MYGWVWRHLPGGTAAKASAMAVLILAFAAVLWFGVFPWAWLHLPLDAAGMG